MVTFVKLPTWSKEKICLLIYIYCVEYALNKLRLPLCCWFDRFDVVYGEEKQY